jgi:DUF4097 and DUF4098 domain-containing protein YvlB
MRYRNAKTRLGLTLLALLPASAMAWGDGCEFTAERAAGIDAKGVEKVVIRTGAGDLKVVGGERNVRIEARGTACAAKQELLDKTQLTVRREGNTVYVETALPQDNTDGWKFGNNDYAYIDTGIALPSGIPVEAVDSSGDAVYEDLKSLALQDSSGDLDVRRIAGLANIGDSSGDIDVRDVGALKLRDSSGDIEASDIRGEVDVDNDSSGDIHISKVSASVRIRNDSSGGIRVEDVKGNVDVDSDSSGDIFAGRVTGNFTVASDSSGSIGHESVGGRVTVPGNKQD